MRITSVSDQVNISLPCVVLESLDNFIKDGDGWDIEPSTQLRNRHPNACAVDISRSALVRYLLTAYGHKITEIADLINAELVSNQEPCRYITVRTRHPDIINDKNTRQYRLVSAMVYMGIPIDHYFNGKTILF